MTDKQATWELLKEREAQPIETDNEMSITLSCGDGEAEVFYVADGVVTTVCIGEVNIDASCFSRWQIEQWEKSIERHIRAEAESYGRDD